MVPLSSETLKCSYSPEPFLTFVLQIPLANTQHDTSPSSEVPKEQEEHFLLSQQSPAAASQSDSDAATASARWYRVRPTAGGATPHCTAHAAARGPRLRVGASES